MPRPRIEDRDNLREKVRDYAETEGLRLSRAYADLIEMGLETEGYE